MVHLFRWFDMEGTPLPFLGGRCSVGSQIVMTGNRSCPVGVTGNHSTDTELRGTGTGNYYAEMELTELRVMRRKIHGIKYTLPERGIGGRSGNHPWHWNQKWKPPTRLEAESETAHGIARQIWKPPTGS